MPNGLSKQAYVQDFDCETITLKSSNIFQRTEIVETIYVGALEPY